MHENSWLEGTSPAFRLMIATSWLAPPRWQDMQEKAIREALCAKLDWREFLRLVDRHRTPALSWASLKRVPGLDVPDPVKQGLQKRSDTCRMHAIRHSLQLAAVLKAFNRAGNPAMPFKGPTLSLDLYGDLGLRHSRDLDLAVMQEDIPRAQDCLESLGWRMKSNWFALSPRQWERFLHQEHSLDFVYSNGHGQLELHWHNQWDRPGAVRIRWDKSLPSAWQGFSFHAMNPIDRTLYLCSHGANHAWFRVKWLGDLARVVADAEVDWPATLDESHGLGQSIALLASLRLVQELYGLPEPDLPGNPWKDLPSALVISSLGDPREPATLGTLGKLRARIRKNRRDRMLRVHKNWMDALSELAYSREDFRMLRLPDRLFWVYVPLRPILWVWRAVWRV
jgi:hypothetical protein